MQATVDVYTYLNTAENAQVQPGLKELFQMFLPYFRELGIDIKDIEKTGIGEFREKILPLLREANMAWVFPVLADLIQGKEPQLVKTIATQLARHAIEHHQRRGIHYEGGDQVRDLFRGVYLELHERFRSLTNSERKIREKGGRDAYNIKENIYKTNSAFALAVYQEIVPHLLSMTKISPDRNSAASDNIGVGEVVDVVETIMHAAETGKLVIYGQMCAHYDSGAEHSADSFTKGLASNLSQEKVQRVFSEQAIIMDVCNRFGIEVEVITPQVTADAANIPALVPATFWEYVSRGELADMYVTLDRHAVQLPGMVQKALPQNEKISHKAPSLAEQSEGVELPSISEKALFYCDLFLKMYNQYLEVIREYRIKIQREKSSDGILTDDEIQGIRESVPAVNDWMLLTPDMVEEAIHKLFFGDEWDKERYGATLQTFTSREREVLKQMAHTLAIEGYGALADTKAFYKRYANFKAPQVDEVLLVQQLEERGYLPEKAKSLAEWSGRMTNIKIGARALYNVSLYFALGENLANLNTPAQAAIMMPVEEDRDRWAVDAMNRAYILTRNQRKPELAGQFVPGSEKYAPIFYAKKDLRQPFGAVE